MTFSYSSTGLALALIGVTGCFPDGPGEKGELGNDRFFYECALPADAACDDPSTNGVGAQLEDIPTVALGSIFGIDTENLDSDAFSPTDRLREVQLSSGAVAFEALEEGQAVIVSSVEAGQADDLTHIVVVAPASLGLFKRTPSNDWALLEGDLGDPVYVGDVIELRVAPVDDQSNVLAGALEIVWTAEPAGVVDVPEGFEDNILSVSTDAAGPVTIRASVGELSASIDVAVEEVPQ